MSSATGLSVWCNITSSPWYPEQRRRGGEPAARGDPGLDAANDQGADRRLVKTGPKNRECLLITGTKSSVVVCGAEQVILEQRSDQKNMNKIYFLSVCLYGWMYGWGQRRPQKIFLGVAVWPSKATPNRWHTQIKKWIVYILWLMSFVIFLCLVNKIMKF